ncbi:MAG TPA: SEC-C metal-binding domain-containing protein [Tepidisphaeraceae bacterium]|jgi:uncharacterized protein YecA (UPF0149 family)|nr:SEC-C metal-binding domain-containing protein [Tepidisphaeraceae bacterium]
MLTPEQVVPFLQHDDRHIREQAVRYFQGTSDFGPLTADHYWACIDRLGHVRESLSYASGLAALPQTDSSLHRLLAALAKNPPRRFEIHYQHAARDMEMDVLLRHREEMLACPQLVPHVRRHLELRLSLLDENPTTAWERLLKYGNQIAGEYANGFDASPSDALIEAAARSSDVCALAKDALTDRKIIDSWNEIFAVRVLGKARYEPAIDRLIDKFAIDADVLCEEAMYALVRIGSMRIIERIVDFYPGKPWHVRLYTNGPLPKIKRPQSVDALMKLLHVELELAADGETEDEGSPLIDQILIDITELCSLEGLDESRKLIAQDPENPEVIDLRESLLAVSIMSGQTLPEAPQWQKLMEANARRYDLQDSSFESLAATYVENWMRTGMSYPPRAQAQANDPPPDFASHPIAEARDLEVTAPIRNTAPKVGRNDPCPCGSGKKYKKCCGK